jgi:hypothetical protein
MFRIRATIAASAALVQIACASTQSAKSAATKRDLAVQVALNGISEEQYRSIMTMVSQSMTRAMEKVVEHDGKKLPPRFVEIVSEITAEEIPYSTVIDLCADFYERDFTQAELGELLAIRQSAVYRKEVRLVVGHMQEVGQRVRGILEARQSQIVSKLKARFAAQTETPSR